MVSNDKNYNFFGWTIRRKKNIYIYICLIQNWNGWWLRGPKCAKRICATPLYHHYEPELVIQGRMHLWCFCQILTPYHLNVKAEIETPQTSQTFSNLLLSKFGEPVPTVVLVSCSYLTGVALGMVFCCCGPSDVFSVQRCSPANLSCVKVTSG